MGEQIDKKSEMKEKEGKDGRTGGGRVGVRTKEMDLKRRGTKQGLVYNGKVQKTHGKKGKSHGKVQNSHTLFTFHFLYTY